MKIKCILVTSAITILAGVYTLGNFLPFRTQEVSQSRLEQEISKYDNRRPLIQIEPFCNGKMASVGIRYFDDGESEYAPDISVWGPDGSSFASGTLLDTTDQDSARRIGVSIFSIGSLVQHPGTYRFQAQVSDPKEGLVKFNGTIEAKTCK